MLEKLQQNPESIPSPSVDEVMKVCTEIYTTSVFKKNMIALSFDGYEDHLASQMLLSLVEVEMFLFKKELLISHLPPSIQALNNIIDMEYEETRVKILV